MNTILRFLLLLVLVLFIGCGNGNSVTGKVTFSDGTPLTSGEVMFSTSTFLAAGKIQPDGTYVIHANNMKEGIPKGNYTVTVKAYEKIDSGTITATTTPVAGGESPFGIWGALGSINGGEAKVP
jgi:hypothetical protein